jgi:alpha-beta hydrolase superfamily lysophospholipase
MRVMSDTQTMLAETRESTQDFRTYLLPAADGVKLFVRRWLGDSLPRAIVQIAHGIAEHSARYARLAAALNGQGYAVYAHDHRGHGHTARNRDELGFVSEQWGWRKCLEDLWRVNRHIAAEHPGVPIVLLGHSMGSFMTQQFICEHGDSLCAAVLAGTTGKPKRGAALVRRLARLERLRVGARGKSFVLDALTLGAFNRQMDVDATPFDWLSRDAAEVDKYAADPLCGGFRPSVQLSLDVLQGMVEMSQPELQSRIPKELPIFILAGTSDPVGENGEGVERLMAAYFDARLECVMHRFYTDARHELFNEINRNQVTRDLIDWLDVSLAIA